MRPFKKIILKPDLYIIKDNQKERSIIYDEIDEEVLNYVSGAADVYSPETLFISTTNHFNIRNSSNEAYKAIINLSRINDVKDIDKLLEVVNEKLHSGGTFVACAETEKLRYERLLRKFIFPLNYIYYFLDFVFKRIFPKLPITSRIYFFLTAGRNRVLSKVEL